MTQRKIVRFAIFFGLVSLSLYFVTIPTLFLVVWFLLTVSFTSSSFNFINIPSTVLQLFSSRAYKIAVFRFLSKDHLLYKGLSNFFAFMSYHVTFKSLDRGFLEFLGPFGIASTLRSLVRNLSLRFSTHFFSSLFLVVLCAFLIGLAIFASSFDDIVFLIFLILASSFLIK